jgi:hypothetical protein
MDLQLALNNSHQHTVQNIAAIQASSRLSVISITLTGFVVILHIITRFLSPKFDSQEPPVIPQKIPFIGHVLGLAKHGITYYLEVRSVLTI